VLLTFGTLIAFATETGDSWYSITLYASILLFVISALSLIGVGAMLFRQFLRQVRTNREADAFVWTNLGFFVILCVSLVVIFGGLMFRAPYSVRGYVGWSMEVFRGYATILRGG